jgi:VWFA-related protein
VVVLALLLPVSVGGEQESEEKRTTKDLPEHWRVWVEDEVYPLITKEQKRAFLALDTEAQRTAFAERLWILWGRQTGFGTAFRSMYDERLAFARSEFGNTFSDRARVLLIQGPPTFRFTSRCPEFFNPMDIWAWSYIEGLGQDVVVVFYQSGGMGQYRMWYGIEGRRVLSNVMRGADTRGWAMDPGSRFDSPYYRCPDGDTLMALLAAAEMWGRDPAYLQAMTQFRPPREGRREESSSNRFMEFSALVDKKSEPLEFTIRDQSWGARGGLVQMAFAVSVDGDELGNTPVGDLEVVQLDVIGEISRQAQMVDRFRYVFSVPAAHQELGLRFERFIRPGDYTLRLKVEDVHSNRASVAEHAFSATPEPSPDLAPDVVESAWLDDEDPGNGVVPEDEAGEQPLIKLVGPEGEAISGVRRFEAVVLPDVQRVRFLVDDEVVLTKNRPPFDVDLDLGPLPRLTTVTVIGYDARGQELGRDGLSLNVGRERFYLRLEPLSAAAAGNGKVRVAADLNIPSEIELLRLEFFWNDVGLATVEEPPYEAWVTLDRSGDFGYLRAVAIMSDGSVAEDIQFVNAPEFGEVIEVTAVELPVTVLAKDGRPVRDLLQEDFRVLEDGVEQTISHFSLHQELPVRLGIVIDTSGSMEQTLPTVQRVVMGFLRNLLRPQDRAYIETFSDQPDLLAAFTADFKTLENALLALFADRATALYDSVIMGLFQFSGVRGRKAMVVLTDGEDTASKNDFESVVGYAQRAGVTIYTIGVELPITKVAARYQLNKLAEVTGGQAFFVSSDTELEGIYSEIDRELRTQYLLAYTSSSEKAPGELRKVKVEVDRKKVRVRTISGYYPGGI